MAILELSIPPHFFDSAKPENNFESVSERIARAFLSGILNIADLRRGDPEAGEPDYIANEKGYEVTFSISQSLIPQLRGVRKLDGSKRNVEQSLISDINDAVLRKAKKNYSSVPNLVILTISTLPTWYYSLYFDTSNPCDRLAMKYGSARRDQLFRELYQNYILTNKFENIYISFSRHLIVHLRSSILRTLAMMGMLFLLMFVPPIPKPFRHIELLTLEI